MPRGGMRPSKELAASLRAGPSTARRSAKLSAKQSPCGKFISRSVVCDEAVSASAEQEIASLEPRRAVALWTEPLAMTRRGQPSRQELAQTDNLLQHRCPRRAARDGALLH
jgi:hypothetical protein